MPEHHLVSVWNPAYAANGMDAHVQLLLESARRHRDGEIEEEEVHVWWGKVKSVNRQQPIPHLSRIIDLDEQLHSGEDLSAEMHLYLTDYRSLYVGHVAEITAEDIRENVGENIPDFYQSPDIACDCWFKLFDIRRIVSDDTLSVVNELKRLRNTLYHDKPVSIYGGMVDLPLIVFRDDDARYFDPDVRDELTDGKFWVEFDAERIGVGAMERELRENLFGEEAWSGLDPAARSFIATAEKLFRDQRSDAASDFSPMLMDLAKAAEVQTGVIFREAVRGLPVTIRTVNVEGRSIDLGRTPISLGQMARVLNDNGDLNNALVQRLPQGGAWFRGQLPAILAEIADARNPAAHSARLDREKAVRLRNQLVGVGCDGTLMKLGQIGARQK